MSLLVDNQLPVALARYLHAHNWECVHVQDIGLGEHYWMPVMLLWESDS